MLAFADHACTLKHINVRVEKHGDEEAVACDLKMETQIGAAWLSMFDPDLRRALYKSESERDNPDLVSQAQPDELTVLRCRILEPLKLVYELDNARVQLAFPVSGEQLVLPEAKANSFVLSPLDGGTVGLTFRLQSTIEPEDAASITEMLTKQVQLTLQKNADPQVPLGIDPPADGDNDGSDED